MDAPYDVFLSLSGDDRVPARRLLDALRAGGLKVFIDEQDIDYFAGISRGIEDALRSSRVLVAYYSTSFPARSACQFELTAAFLAGQRENDPCRRIVVVNPVDTPDHIEPAELADAKYAVLPAARDEASMASLVARIRARVDAVTGTIGGVGFTARPRWLAERLPGFPRFVGRYREQWQLHSALNAGDYPLTQHVTGASVAVLAGLPGIGKTALAAAYAWQFGAAYLGGVYWLSLGGSGPAPADVRARFGDAVRAAAELARMPVDGLSDRRVLAMFADHIAGKDDNSLVVIDEVPAGLDAEMVNILTIPAGDRLRTVLIVRESPHRSPVSPIDIGPMSQVDAVALLRSHRTAETADDLDALDRLAIRLDGHPYALDLVVAEALRDREGLVSPAAYAAQIDSNRSLLAPVTEMIRDSLASLDPAQALILHLMALGAIADAPVGYIERVLADITTAGTTRVGDALADLRDRRLASRTGHRWRVHALVSDAVWEGPGPAVPLEVLVNAAADAIVAMRGGGLDALDVAGLVRHAEALAGRPELSVDRAERLLDDVAGYYDARGAAVLAAQPRRRLADRHPDAAGPQAEAAAVLHRAGDHEAAVEYALRAIASTDEPRLTYSCERVLAEALDALGRYADADPYWAKLSEYDDAGAPLGLAERLAARVAIQRRKRMRGSPQAAKGPLMELIDSQQAPAPEIVDEIQAAKLELARVQLMTNEQPAARRIAASVIEHYQRRVLPDHQQALAAQEVFAEAQLALNFWQLRTDPAVWREAEATLATLRDGYQRSHGRRNTFTLTASVAHAFALVSLGQPSRAADELRPLMRTLSDRLGDHHPLYFRASFLLGQSATQLGDFTEARQWYEIAFAGECVVLEATHPRRLRTQFELGVVLKMTGDRHRAAAMFRAVRQAAPRGAGYGTDLFAQSLMASALNLLPAVIWRKVAEGQTKGQSS